MRLIRHMAATFFSVLTFYAPLFPLECHSVFSPLDYKAKVFQLNTGAFVPVLHPDVIPFQHGLAEGVRTNNFQLRLHDGTQRAAAADAVAISLARGAEQQMKFDVMLTDQHRRFGNSFAKTTDDGRKIEFTPEVSSVPMALHKDAFNHLVVSTAPIMQALRTLLQSFYGWGATKLTVAHLIKYLPGLTAEEVLDVLTVMERSAYFEPFLRNPVMGGYPFLPVARFDSIVSDPEQPRTEFFEFNAGTPSGLSNLKQLLWEMRDIGDPAFTALARLLVPDDSFGKLRQSIASAAEQWTGSKDGIVVTIGPGPKNGAHPDIVNTALFSGMPYVDMQDLYIDGEGNVRLQTIGPHPRVTGIYNRREESYLLQSTNLGIPLRNPYFAGINAQIAQKQGLNLAPNVGYKVFYQNNQPDHVEVDAGGLPLLQDLIDGIGVNPHMPDAAVGSLAEAVLQKRLYVSNLGGRVVDDKHLFELLVKGLKPLFPILAAPPPTLDIPQKTRLAAGPSLKDFVVKETNKSGGDGVYIMALLPDAKREEIRRMVTADPGAFVVQRFADLATTLVATSGPNGQVHFQARVVDWGLFVYQDADGNVRSDPLSVLPRVAGANGLSTNTSRGAGYGIAAVVDKIPHATLGYDVGQPFVPFLTVSQQNNLSQLIQLLNLIQPSRRLRAHYPVDLGQLKEAIRLVMPVLGRQFFPMMSLCDEPHDVRFFIQTMMTWKSLLKGNNPNIVVVNTAASVILRGTLR